MVNINYNRTWKMLLLAIIILSPIYYVVLAGDQIRSNVFVVDSGSQEAQISSAIDLPVTYYIGNDLSGVTNAAKRAFFRVSGVYTGGGSIQFKIDSDNATAKTFTLPSVSRPTDFEFIYSDDSGHINPTSAGSYNRILNIMPSGVTISGLAAKLELTYQFAPTTCVDGASSNEKVKTTEFFVGQDNGILSSTMMPFTIYLGDDLTGITNPVKSVYFLVSGVYTGSGTLSITNDSSGTSTVFSLANVSVATNFNLLFKDKYNLINPTSAGSYSYNLYLNPSGPTISNVSVKAIVTHRYKPAGCGAGYPPYGDLVSTVYDSTANSSGPAYNSILWKGQLGGPSFDQGLVRFQVAAADNSTGPWNFVGGATCGSNDWYEASANTAIELGCFSDLNNKRYFKYKIRICADDCISGGTVTPQVDDVVVNFSP
jgi:hypothetical protein